jgi:hypothetical protein
MLIWSSGHDVGAHAGEGGGQAGPLNWSGSSAEELAPRAEVARKPCQVRIVRVRLISGRPIAVS